MKLYTPYKYILLIFLVCLITNSKAQGLKIKSGTSVAVNGSTYIKIANGDFVNNGTYQGQSETITLSGNSEHYIKGTGTTNTYKVDITNTGGIKSNISLLTTSYLNIVTGSKLTIDTASAINAKISIINNVGNDGIIIKSSENKPGGSLIFQNSFSSPLSATVEMYSKAFAATYTNNKYSNYKWQFIGIPVRSADVLTTFTGSYVRKFNETGTGIGTSTAYHWITTTGGSMSSFTGYEITQPAPKTYYFKGYLENRDFSSGKLSYTPSAQYPGQHLIGNPYTSAINIDKIEFGSNNENVIEKTIYIYNSGSYSEWVAGGSGTVDNATSPGQYFSIPQGVAGEYGIYSQIPSMQAFLVIAKSDNDSANIKIPYSSTGTVSKNLITQKQKKVPNPCTIIEVKSASYSDKTWIFTKANCTSKFDNGYDGKRIIQASDKPIIYSVESDNNYQINSKNNINNTIIGFIPGSETEYSLIVSQKNSSDIYPQMYLLDLETGSTTDISADSTQIFFSATNQGIATDRFKIITSKDVTTETEDSSNKVEIKVASNILTILNNTSNSANISLYDVSGKKLLNIEIEKNTTINRQLDLVHGVYLVKATNGKEKLISKSIIL